ncbi:MAG: serine/threonine protein kinase, partial [Lentisphaerae bacterium]
MRLKLTCKHCRRNIQIEGDHEISGSIECPNCSKHIEIPSNILDVDTMVGGFRIEKHLGSGSMGCVYLARQVSMDRQVALKVLPPHVTSDEEELNNFFHEVRTLAKMDHPNIVTAFEAGESNNTYFLAMTYVAGETLEEKLMREKMIDQDLAIKIAIKIGDALNYAWEKFHLLHRDLKPENIMIDEPSGEPKLLDLGISKIVGDDARKTISSDGFLVGTPYYMSPEQAQNREDLDIRSDIYSLGCTLYHLVTGEVPYSGENVMQVL